MSSCDFLYIWDVFLNVIIHKESQEQNKPQSPNFSDNIEVQTKDKQE